MGQETMKMMMKMSQTMALQQVMIRFFYGEVDWKDFYVHEGGLT